MTISLFLAGRMCPFGHRNVKSTLSLQLKRHFQEPLLLLFFVIWLIYSVDVDGHCTLYQIRLVTDAAPCWRHACPDASVETSAKDGPLSLAGQGNRQQDNLASRNPFFYPSQRLITTLPRERKAGKSDLARLFFIIYYPYPWAGQKREWQVWRW